jgi:hypothetical protein
VVEWTYFIKSDNKIRGRIGVTDEGHVCSFTIAIHNKKTNLHNTVNVKNHLIVIECECVVVDIN